jgi:hypothetical protein
MDVFFFNVLQWLIEFYVGIFALLGLGILIYLRKFILSIKEWRKSVFGLEQDIAKQKLVSASTGLMLFIILFVGEFLLVTIIQPQLPSQPTERIAENEPIRSQTATLSSSSDSNAPLSQQATPSLTEGALESECIEDVLEITSPVNGERISGIVEIVGSVNIESFAYYKYEYSTVGTINWNTIAAEDQKKLNESLGNWNVSDLTPGTYLLQIVVIDNENDALTPCIISVEVVVEE